MEYKNYVLSYTCYDNTSKVIKSGKMRVKRKLSELEAKVKLEVLLKTKLYGVASLVIHSCKEDNIFNEIFGNFESNPFSNF